MSKNEVFIGGNHHVQIPGLGLMSGKIIKQLGRYFICKEYNVTEAYYLISSTGKLQIFPIEGSKMPEIEQHFTDGVFILEDKSPDVPRIILFKQYSIEQDILSLVDVVHKQNVNIPIAN